MIRICYCCGKNSGQNGLEPLEEETHGLCDICYPIQMAETEKLVDQLILDEKKKENELWKQA